MNVYSALTCVKGFFRDRLMKALDTPKELETGILGYMTFHSLVMAYTPIPKVCQITGNPLGKMAPGSLIISLN